MQMARRAAKLPSRFVGAFAAAMALVAASALPANAAESIGTTSAITVKTSIGSQTTAIQLNFDKAIPAAEASKIRSTLVASSTTPDRTATSTKQLAASGDLMWCGGFISDGDAYSYFTIEYQCGQSPRRLPWGWKLIPPLSTQIVPGTLNEKGLEWWRDGVFRGQNGPHSGLPGDYQIHGNINPVYRGNDVDYQDYATFRHTIGSGGSGSVSWAGSVVLQN